MDDGSIELKRYETRALDLLRSDRLEIHDLSRIPLYLREPYIRYYEVCRSLIDPSMTVLELGSGTGFHSKVLVDTGANVICTDISPASLLVLSKVFEARGLAVKTVVTPMETTPFENASFDVIVSAGSLSYADPKKLDVEIIRLLKPNGSFICVDSFDHNLIYRFNRWIHWRVIGDRTVSTIQRIPTLLRMKNLGCHFDLMSIEGFGAWAWLCGPLAFLFGQRFAASLTRIFDSLPGSQRLAFKIVFVAQKLRRVRM